jgi:hypothetical protein
MMADEQKPKTGTLGDRNVLQSPLSVIKLDISQLRDYTAQLNDFLRTERAAAIKICECCINVD